MARRELDGGVGVGGHLWGSGVAGGGSASPSVSGPESFTPASGGFPRRWNHAPPKRHVLRFPEWPARLRYRCLRDSGGPVAPSAPPRGWTLPQPIDDQPPRYCTDPPRESVETRDLCPQRSGDVRRERGVRPRRDQGSRREHAGDEPAQRIRTCRRVRSGPAARTGRRTHARRGRTPLVRRDRGRCR